MHHFKSRALGPSQFLMFLPLLLALVANVGYPEAATEIGVISANEDDRPSVMNPDIESRSIDPDMPPAYGPEDAKVLIVLFSDYQCPHCRRANQATHQISAEFPGDVRIEVWHHPLSNHPEAKLAAAAAMAAQRQGRFWEMHDRIFLTPSKIDVTSLEGYAQSLGLDLARFRSDMNDSDVANRLQHEIDVAQSIGARRTPGFLINGKLTQGWASWKYFRNAVAREVKAADALAASGMDPAEIRYQRALDNITDSVTFEAYRVSILGEPDI